MLDPTLHMPLAKHALLDTTSVQHARDHLSSLFWPHRLKVAHPRAPVRFRHNRAHVGSVSLNALRYGSEVQVDAQPSDQVYLVKFTLAGASEVSQDRDTVQSTAGMVCVMNPTRRLRVRLSEDHNQLTLRIEGEQVHEALERELGRRIHRALEFKPGSYSYLDTAPALGRLVRSLCEDLSAERGAFGQRRASEEREETLIRLLLHELPHSHTDLLWRAVDQPVPADFARVVDYIHAHACEDVRLGDLAKIAGSSARALQSAFQRHFECTPMAYLREQRLRLAHRRLRHAAVESGQIAEIALACGFTHLGRFAAYYRDKYGERPSATLARSCRVGGRR